MHRAIIGGLAGMSLVAVAMAHIPYKPFNETEITAKVQAPPKTDSFRSYVVTTQDGDTYNISERAFLTNYNLKEGDQFKVQGRKSLFSLTKLITNLEV